MKMALFSLLDAIRMSLFTEEITSIRIRLKKSSSRSRESLKQLWSVFQTRCTAKKPRAFIVKNGAQRLTEEDVIAFCQERLSAYKIPEVEFVNELPKNNLGKVKKRRLAQAGRTFVKKKPATLCGGLLCCCTDGKLRLNVFKLQLNVFEAGCFEVSNHLFSK